MRGNVKEYDVVIIGGGVTGTALLYILSAFTDIKRVLLLEKYGALAQVNSASKNNSQTLHFGDIETNYSLEKASVAKDAAKMILCYLHKIGNPGNIAPYGPGKMVLGVGEDEIKLLEERYEKFKKLFPNLKKLRRDEIAKIEPMIVIGRDTREKILALYSPEVCVIDFGKLAESFVERSKNIAHERISVFLNTKVKGIKKNGQIYEILSSGGSFKSKSIVVAAGAHSLLFAKSIGYGKEYSVLPVVGGFYYSPAILNNKVYTVQREMLPFTSIHGDPDFNALGKTRFGPTTRLQPWLEPRKYSTFIDFLKTFGFGINVFLSIIKILSDGVIGRFILKNFSYDIPFFGKKLYLREARKIVPTLQLKDFHYAKGIGGIRPQIVDTKNKKLLMGEVKIIGDNIIFNMTPSPGASMCLKSAESDAKKIVEFFAGEYNLDQKRLDKILHKL